MNTKRTRGDRARSIKESRPTKGWWNLLVTRSSTPIGSAEAIGTTRSSNPSLYTRTDHTVPYGTARWGVLSQALRARLRSCSPSGTFAGISHTTIMRTAPPQSQIKA
jgi:hypothetical protein